MRAPRMWGVARDPKASLGRRGAHRAGLMGVSGGRGGVIAREGRAIFIDFARVATDPISAEMASCGLL